MGQETWTAVENFLTDTVVKPDDALYTALKSSFDADLPNQHVTPSQGKFLKLLAQIQGARSVLEIGTLGGYSTIWLAHALPKDGELISLELDSDRAELARQNITLAGLGDIVEVRNGDAVESLQILHDEGHPPFDFIFIDADIPNNAVYLEWALRFSRIGTIIVCDNVVREGEIIDQDTRDPRVRGAREYCEMVGREPRLEATVIQTVGSKRYDGFSVARVIS